MTPQEKLQSNAIDAAIYTKSATRSTAADALREIMRESMTETNAEQFTELINYILKPAKPPRGIVTPPTFISKAISTDKERSALNVAHADGEHVYATDGRRLHRFKCGIDGRFTYDKKEKTLKQYEDEHADTFPASTCKSFFDASKTDRLTFSHLEAHTGGLIARVYTDNAHHPQLTRINHAHYIDAITHDSAPEVFRTSNDQVQINSLNVQAILMPLRPA